MTSQAELDGAYWLLEQRDPDIEIITQGTDQVIRYGYSLWGTQGTNYRKLEEAVPDHFGYTQHGSIGEAVGEDRLMMLRSGFLISMYEGAWAKVGRFNENDFKELEMDISTDKLYDNGEVDVWYVRGQTPAE